VLLSKLNQPDLDTIINHSNSFLTVKDEAFFTFKQGAFAPDFMRDFNFRSPLGNRSSFPDNIENALVRMNIHS
jgi:hypothetical protein